MDQQHEQREFSARTLLISVVMAVAITALITHAPTTTQTVTPTATPTPLTTVTSTFAPPPPPLSTPDAKIHDEVDGAVAVVDQTWTNLLASWSDPVVWNTPVLYNGDGFFDSRTGDTGPMCGDSPVGPSTASFCPATFAPGGTSFLSWDTQFFRDTRYYGRPAVYMVIAHEMGHAAQTRFLPPSDIEAFASGTTVAYELQADCIGGATLARAQQTGLVTFTSEDRQAMADANLHPATNTDLSHGTPQQRNEYFQRGYATADMETCFDSTPPSR